MLESDTPCDRQSLNDRSILRDVSGFDVESLDRRQLPVDRGAADDQQVIVRARHELVKESRRLELANLFPF